MISSATQIRAILALVLASALALGAAVPASAEELRGRTQQGRGVTLTTDAAGAMVHMTIRWSAPCRNGNFRATSVYRPRQPRLGNFRLGGRSRSKQKPYTFLLKTKIGGKQDTPPPGATWNGNFKAVVVVKQGKRKIDRCVSQNIAWEAGP
jgi:hypothetical protein